MLLPHIHSHWLSRFQGDILADGEIYRMAMDWHKLRREGFLTLAIVLAASVLLITLLPVLDLREALLIIAILALLLGWT